MQKQVQVPMVSKQQRMVDIPQVEIVDKAARFVRLPVRRWRACCACWHGPHVCDSCPGRDPTPAQRRRAARCPMPESSKVMGRRPHDFHRWHDPSTRHDIFGRSSSANCTGLDGAAPTPWGCPTSHSRGGAVGAVLLSAACVEPARMLIIRPELVRLPLRLGSPQQPPSAGLPPTAGRCSWLLPSGRPVLAACGLVLLAASCSLSNWLPSACLGPDAATTARDVVAEWMPPTGRVVTGRHGLVASRCLWLLPPVSGRHGLAASGGLWRPPSDCLRVDAS